MNTATSKPRLLILATGGTIAGRVHSGDTLRYTSGLVGIDALLQATTGFDIAADIAGEQIASVGSQDMSEAIWWQLHQCIKTAGVDGVVITHGTDTIEETAFLLDLVVEAGAPVVLVGAMRPANALGADGPRNLACAIRAAASPQSRDRGVLVVIADMVHSARHVRKALTSGTDGFRSWPGGPIGTASPLGVSYHAPPMSWVMRGRYALPEGAALPPVGIVYAHAGMDAAMAAAMTASGAAGIVLAGMGHGNAPAAVLDVLAEAARAGDCGGAIHAGRRGVCPRATWRSTTTGSDLWRAAISARRNAACFCSCWSQTACCAPKTSKAPSPETKRPPLRPIPTPISAPS